MLLQKNWSLSFLLLIIKRDVSFSHTNGSPTATKITPLKRTAILGQNQVQGVDYAYTLQGWLKGVNSTSVGDGSFDMGGDGKVGGGNSNIARDAYGFSLNYFTGDYKPIGNSSSFAGITVPPSGGGGGDLFSGNINAMAVNIPKLGDAKVYGYKYDQLNRLVAMDTYNGLNNATNVFTPGIVDDYKERIAYDANGNILWLIRIIGMGLMGRRMIMR